MGEFKLIVAAAPWVMGRVPLSPAGRVFDGEGELLEGDNFRERAGDVMALSGAWTGDGGGEPFGLAGLLTKVPVKLTPSSVTSDPRPLNLKQNM